MEDWYAHWFGEDYIQLYPHRNQEEALRQLDFVAHILPELEPGMRVLDLCCGAGGLQLARCDMRRLPFGAIFHLVANFFTSFGYFPTDTENAGIFEAIGAVLRPGGFFLVDYLNPDQVRETLVPESTGRLPDGSEVRQQRRINEETCLVEKDILITAPNGETRSFQESVRLYSREQMAGMIDRAGLCLDRVYGDFDPQAEYSSVAPRMILVGHKDNA